MTETKPLKYLFGAVMENGSIFEQTAEDISTQDPQRSAFYDVNQEALRVFYLSDANHVFLVDLQDGHFEIDGIKFRLHEEGEFDGCKFGLEFQRRYWQEHTAEFAFDGKDWNPTGKTTDVEPREPAYRLGFSRQANPVFMGYLESIERNLPKMNQEQLTETALALLKTVREMGEHLNRKIIEFD